MKSRTKQATILDIAKETGYSPITVSRALSNPNLVKEKTRLTIEAKAKELNYSSNTIARALVSKRTNIIMLYVPDDIGLVHPFCMNLIAGVSEILGERGFSLRISRNWYNGELCDGIIMMGVDYEDADKLVEVSKSKPTVFFGSLNVGGIDWIDVDNFFGSKIMSDYMIEKGYKNIGYIAIRQHRKFTDDRAKGHLESLIKHNVLAKDANIIGVPNNENEGYQAAKALLSNVENLDAIICASDLLALGAMRALGEAGKKVPQDIAVTGFDGLGYEKFTHPTLTTIRQPVFDIGKMLAERIIEKINDPSSKPQNIYIKPALIIGESTL